MTSKYIIDSRDLHKDLNIRYKHADWVKSFIKRLGLVENEDYITYREGKKHMYRFSEAVLEKLNNKPKQVSVEDLPVTVPQRATIASEGLIDIDGIYYMSTTNLASISEKPHRTVLRDVDTELVRVKDLLESCKKNAHSLEDSLNRVIDGIKESTYTTNNNQTQRCYLLDRTAALFMAAKYSTEVRVVLAASFVKSVEDLESYATTLENSKNNLEYRHVYVICDNVLGSSKIGVAKDPKKRLANLQTGTMSELYIAYQTPMRKDFFDIETRAHRHFKEYSVSGEWFNSKLAPEVIVQWLEEQVTD